jgi:glycosyltransferase involved in cell wall biosynthesis
MGPGDEKRAELQDLARRDGTLGTRVFFRAPVAQRDILRYSRAADAGIIPYPHLDLNSYYCTPNKLFDFLAAGVPILANDSPELRRFVADQGVGMVHPFTDSTAIAEGIDRFFAVDHAPFHARLGEIGGSFTWQHEGSKLVALYEQMIAAGTPAVRRGT